MSKIEDAVRFYTECPVEPTPIPDLLLRAFRFKHFSRCPMCDQKTMHWTSLDFFRMGHDIWCSSCKWAFYYWDSMELEQDDLILDIVRGVPRLDAYRAETAALDGEGVE